MSREEQRGIDQALCWAIWQARQCGGDLSVGDAVKDLTIPHTVTGSPSAVDSQVGEATVEQRHIDAVELFKANYGLGVVPWSVTLRVQPAELTE